MAFSVGEIEAKLSGTFDDSGFSKFDAAMAAAKKETAELSREQAKQATASKGQASATKSAATAARDKTGAVKQETTATEQGTRSTEENTRATDQGAGAKREYRRATDESRRASGLWNDVADRQKKNFETLTTWTKRAAIGLGAMGAAGVGYGIKLNAQWETNEASFGTLLGSMERGKKLMEDLRQVSSQSYLRLTDFQEASKAMLGMGVAAKDLVPLMSGVNAAVVAVGGNSETLNRVTMALGQMQAKGKASGEEMRQLAEAGLPINEILQKELGLTAEQVGNIGNEGIESGKVLKAVSESWQEKYGPGLERSMKTGNAQFQLLVKNGEGFLRMATEGIYNKIARKYLPELNDELALMSKVLADPKLTDEQKFEKLEKSFDRLSKKALEVAEDALPKIFDVLERLAPKVAEKAGKIGLKMAGALAKAFLNSGWLGKLAIGGWLIHVLGGWPAIGRLGGRVGGRIAVSLGKRFLAAVAPYFAADVAADGLGAAVSARMPGMAKASGGWGRMLGKAFGAAFLAAAVAWGFNKVKDHMNEQAGGAQDNWDRVGGPPINPAQEKARGWAGKAWEGIKGLSGFGGYTGGLVTDHGIRGYAQGGPVLDPRDTVPAMLSPGEFVVRKKAVDKLGVPFLRDLNQGGDVQKEAADGADEITGSYEDIEKKVDRTTEKTEKTVLDRFKRIRKGTGKDQDRIETSMRDSWRKIDRDHGKRVREIDKETTRRFGGMRSTVAARGGEMVTSMRSTMGNLTSAVDNGFAAIEAQTNKALKAFGVSPVSFSSAPASGEGKKHAGGGFIAGSGKQDTVPLMLGWAAPGEAILNGAQQAEVEQSLAMTRAMGLGNYGTLDELFSGVTTPHYAFARGGRIPEFAGGGFMELAPAARGLAQQLSGMGFTPTSTRRVTTTFHGSGDAIDYGDSINNLPRLWSILRPRAGQFAELFGPTYLTPPTLMHNGAGFSDAKLQADHQDHIHVALLGALAGGLAPVQIKKMLLSGPDGALKAGGQGALDKVWKAAKKHASQQMAASMVMAGDGDGANSEQVMGWLRQALQITGHMSPANLQALYGRAIQESGGDPRAVNNWDSNAAAGDPSKGILQTTGSTFAAHMLPGYENIWNPVHNAVAAIRYMFAKYGHIVGPSSTGYAGGGFIDGKKGVLRGKVSWFNDAETASGKSLANAQGLALNLSPGTDAGGWNNQKTQGWMSAARQGKPYYADVGIEGKHGIFPILDLGPNESTGRAIDVSTAAVRAMGFNPSNFPTDATGTAWLLGQSRKPRKGSPSFRGSESGGSRQREKEQNRKKQLAAKKRRDRMWKRRRRTLRGQRRETAEEFQLPRFRKDLRPKLTRPELRETERWHDPITDETGAYGIAWNALDRIDPNLRKVRNKLIGSFDLGADFDGMTLRERYAWQDRDNRETTRDLDRMRKHVGGLRERDLKRGQVGWTRGKFDPAGKKTRKLGEKQIRKLYSEEIARRAKLIRQQSNSRKKQIMKPVHRRRGQLRNRWADLTERGEMLQEIIQDSGRTIRATRTVQASQGQAFQFAQGGRVGQPIAVGGGGTPPIVLNVEITDPVLSALNPQIDVRIGKTGKRAAARGRAGGGRKARL